MKNLLPFFTSLLLLVGCGTQAHAQLTNATDDEPVSYTEGLYLNPHYGGYGHAVEDYQVGFGQGVGLKAGYGFTSLFTMYAGFDVAVMQVATHEDNRIQELRELKRYIYPLGVLDLGGQLNFRVGPKEIVPYLDGSVNVIISSYDTDAGYGIFAGDGLSVGGGIKYYVSPELALDGIVGITGATYESLGLENRTETINLGVLMAEVQFGISWYPFGE